jgi:DNA repair protein RecO (recombination protein O)
MLVKTSGIVLHSVRYNDSSTIVTIYTRNFGRTSYRIYGANKKSSVFRASFHQPLSMLEMDVLHSLGREIQQIKDARMEYQFAELPFDPIKNSLALFISELLFRSLRQTEPDENLYLFLENSIQQLDFCKSGIANFHLVFLLKLTRYLGFEPNQEEERAYYFDLMNGVFQSEKPLHPHFLSLESTNNFLLLLNADYSNMDKLILSRENRTNLLKGMIEYYRLHIPEFHGLHSLAVLQSLFD